MFFKTAKEFLAFTGTLDYLEVQCIEEVFGSCIVNYPRIFGDNVPKNQCKMEIEFSNKEEWLSVVTKSIDNARLKTPILILATPEIEKAILKYMNNHIAEEININTLINKDPITIDVAISNATQFEEKKGYPILFIDENLSRGLDMKSNPQIEENGGVYVIIAKVPST